MKAIKSASKDKAMQSKVLTALQLIGTTGLFGCERQNDKTIYRRICIQATTERSKTYFTSSISLKTCLHLAFLFRQDHHPCDREAPNIQTITQMPPAKQKPIAKY